MGILKNVGIGIDQTGNCLVKLSDGWGTPDEMLSARAWRLREQHPTLRKVIDGIFFWDKQGPKGHCQLSYESELLRTQLPKSYRSEHA